MWCAVWSRQLLLSCHVCISVCAASSSSSSQVVAVSGPFRPVPSSAPVASRGAVATEKSPPVCEGT